MDIKKKKSWFVLFVLLVVLTIYISSLVYNNLLTTEQQKALTLTPQKAQELILINIQGVEFKDVAVIKGKLGRTISAGAIIEGDLDLHGRVIKSHLDLSSVFIKGNLDLSHCTFERYAKFTSGREEYEPANIDLEGATIEGYLNLIGTNFRGYLNLTAGRGPSKIYVSLKDAELVHMSAPNIPLVIIDDDDVVPEYR